MRAKANLKLRKVGGRYMLVDVSDRDANVTNVYTLNDTAAFVWHLLSEGDTDMESLTAAVCENYDVDSATAGADLRTLIDTWRQAGLVKTN